MSEKSKSKMLAVLQYINEYNAEHGFSPTVREICNQLSIKSTASAYYYIEKLTDEGFLSKSPNKNRAVNFKKNSSVNIPLIGTVTAGQPIFAYENYEDYYSFPADCFKGTDLFMLNVQGDSIMRRHSGCTPSNMWQSRKKGDLSKKSDFLSTTALRSWTGS